VSVCVCVYGGRRGEGGGEEGWVGLCVCVSVVSVCVCVCVCVCGTPGGARGPSAITVKRKESA
jgi:hypothetical protein